MYSKQYCENCKEKTNFINIESIYGKVYCSECGTIKIYNYNN